MLPAPGLVSLSLAFLLIPPFTVTFQVQSDTLEVVVVVGSDAVLPCTLSPPSSADRLEIRWFYNLFHTVLYLLKNGREDRQQQSVQYRNRAWVRSGPKTGN
ncbi:hypothetical protein GDO86_018784 [Hymenochirus boettgeri]|uniref:Uncharacterized protein n=1 Tax=Hymenochirus boettgeri TaxID=247094 RepID=A0A8T2ICI6_9PIPI|nr:hypothetical protein GDO86_018784 [Hymenochirus boettgeri]